MNRSASVVLVRLAPVHFWASHQGLLVRRCDALGTTISLQRNQPMHARRTYDRGRCWQLSAAGAYPWATGLHCALLASCGCVLASTVPRPTIGWHGCLNHFICIILRHSLAAESAGYRFHLGRQLTWGPCATHVLYVVLETAAIDTDSLASWSRRPDGGTAVALARSLSFYRSLCCTPSPRCPPTFATEGDARGHRGYHSVLK